MLQRLTQSARLAHAKNLSPIQHHENSNHSFSPVEPPTAAKIDHHSIEFIWECINNNNLKGDKRLKYSLEEEDPKTHKFQTVYVGYSDTYKIEGLDPIHQYRYRLRVMSKDADVGISPTVTVYTTHEPYNSDHLHKATSKGDLETLSKIITSREVNVDVCDKLGNTPLMNASQNGMLDVVDKLIKSGADVSAKNSSGKNSLMLACYGGHETVVRRLRESGAKWKSADRGGSSPLHWAVDGRNSRLITWIIRDGAPVDAKDNTSGWTPLLRCAALNGDESIAEVLLLSGANVNAVDQDCKTALMIASLNGYLRLVEKLVKFGADIFLTSKHGKTALEMAKSFDRRYVVEYLQELVEHYKIKSQD